ncbi:hypothetical protein H5410_003214, partial [Solanum commersonii]
ILYILLPQQVVGNGVLVHLEKVGLQRDYKTLINLEVLLKFTAFTAGQISLTRAQIKLHRPQSHLDPDPDIAPLTMIGSGDYFRVHLLRLICRMTVLQVVPSMSEVGCFTMSILGTSILHFLSGDVVFFIQFSRFVYGSEHGTVTEW